MRVRDRERVCVCLCVCERERELHKLWHPYIALSHKEEPLNYIEPIIQSFNFQIATHFVRLQLSKKLTHFIDKNPIIFINKTT